MELYLTEKKKKSSLKHCLECLEKTRIMLILSPQNATISSIQSWNVPLRVRWWQQKMELKKVQFLSISWGHQNKAPRWSPALWCLKTLSALWHIFILSAPHLSYSFPNLSIFTFHCRFYIPRFCRSIPPFPHYPPPQHKAVRVLGIRWAVKSYKLLLLCVWPGNRGGRDREKEREILCFNTSEPESPTSPSPPLPPPYSLRHGQAHAQLQDCYPLQPKYLPPQHTYTHSQLLPSSPSSSPALSMWPHNSSALATAALKTPQPLCFSVWVTSQKYSTRSCSPPRPREELFLSPLHEGAMLNPLHAVPPGTPPRDMSKNWRKVTKMHAVNVLFFFSCFTNANKKVPHGVDHWNHFY